MGVFIGIQFLLWTLGGFYFSWTNIDEIHGDHMRKFPEQTEIQISKISALDSTLNVKTVSTRNIEGVTYLWVNNDVLYNIQTGKERGLITEDEAVSVAIANLSDEFSFESAELLEGVGAHHEYREQPLPAWRLVFDGPENITAYVSAKDGSFQRVRHNSWRIFDFLWMTHTMDYEGRDDINNTLLRIFSVLGLLTVGSGFLLFFITTKFRSNRQR